MNHSFNIPCLLNPSNSFSIRGIFVFNMVRSFLIFGFVFLFVNPISAEVFFEKKEKKKPSIFDMMSHKKMLKINLAFSVDEVINNRRNDDEHEALLSFSDKKGNLKNWNIKIKVRGVYRRFNCPEMPPLKLNFKKSDLKEAGLSKFDDYKIVTHCILDEELARKLVLKEYLAYKFYSALTKESFRVQLLQINYLDTKTGIIQQQLGFIIEDFAELRSRIGATKIEKIYGVSSRHEYKLNKEQFQLMSFFQYMIGNTDWSIESIRNIKLCEKDGKWLSIPYDFDFSGLVEAPYAMVSPDYGERTIRDRTFLGFNPKDVPLDNANKIFIKKRRKLNRMIRRLKQLPKSERKNMTMYLDSFYDNLNYIFIKKSNLSGEHDPTDDENQKENDGNNKSN